MSEMINLGVASYYATDPTSDTNGMFANASSLTPEALFFYCQSQLKSIDDDVQAYMDKQKSLNGKKAIYAEFKNCAEANNLSKKSGDELSTRIVATLDGAQKTYDSLIEAGYPEEAEAFNKHIQSFFPETDLSNHVHSATGHKDFSEHDSTHNQLMEPIQNAIDEGSKNAELNMIQLQMLISRRQTAISLTQSILDKQLKTLEQLASKVGG